MKSFFSKIAVLMALLVSVCPQTSAETAPDGVYSGSAFGRNGNINVSVTIKDNAIADVKVTSHVETEHGSRRGNAKENH